jgi:hypothetical protein
VQRHAFVPTYGELWEPYGVGDGEFPIKVASLSGLLAESHGRLGGGPTDESLGVPGGLSSYRSDRVL